MKILDTKCTKCGITFRNFLAVMIDCGIKTLDPCACPEGGDHDFLIDKNEANDQEREG